MQIVTSCKIHEVQKWIQKEDLLTEEIICLFERSKELISTSYETAQQTDLTVHSNDLTLILRKCFDEVPFNMIGPASLSCPLWWQSLRNKKTEVPALTTTPDFSRHSRNEKPQRSSKMRAGLWWETVNLQVCLNWMQTGWENSLHGQCWCNEYSEIIQYYGVIWPIFI